MGGTTVDHDADHAADIERWRQARTTTVPSDRRRSAGVAGYLAATDGRGRSGPPDRRGAVGSWRVDAERCARSHVVDWEWWIADAALYQRRPGAAGRVAETIESLEPAARREIKTESWGAVWSDFRAARDALMAALAGISGMRWQCAIPPRTPGSAARMAGRISRWNTILSTHGLLTGGNADSKCTSMRTRRRSYVA